MENYKILKGYLDENGKFDQLPGKRQKKKQAFMLQFLATQFVEGKEYSEKEVNEILNQHHTFNDPATLRRLMYGSQLIDRTLDGKTYWIPPKNEKTTPSFQIAKHFREIHFGVNWTWSNLKDTLDDVTWEQATTKVYSFNTIAALVYHINYFVDAVLKVLEGGELDAHDKFSFDHPPIKSQEDWEKLLKKVWSDAEKFADLVEQLPERKLWETFSQEKYGIYYRNLHGIIEHSHYHLGQIVLIKKIVQTDS